MPRGAPRIRPSPITSSVDLEQDGVQHGFLKLPYSRDDSAWGAVMIPLAVIKRGAGATALLTGGNHGDEYEGPIALMKLASALDAQRLRGRVIIVPAMNYPAFRAGRRTSPIDARNMNRVFPGRPDGTVTEKIADYFQRTLLPVADVVVDIHSGGKTLEFVPFAAMHRLPHKEQEARGIAAVEAFNAPYSVMLLEIDNVGMYDTAAEEMGKVFVSTELGGGGTARAATVAIAERGLRNVLIHAGILDEPRQTHPSVWLAMPGDDCFVTAEGAGLLEPCVDLGAKVRAGEVVARIHDPERTGSTAVEYRARIDGILAGRHVPGLAQSGDCLAVVAVPRG